MPTLIGATRGLKLMTHRCGSGVSTTPSQTRTGQAPGGSVLIEGPGLAMHWARVSLPEGMGHSFPVLTWRHAYNGRAGSSGSAERTHLLIGFPDIEGVLKE